MRYYNDKFNDNLHDAKSTWKVIDKILKSNSKKQNDFQIENNGTKLSMIALKLTMLLRGPTPFEDMIFYLWTDSNEICTAYVKLKINHILFMKRF